MTSQQNEKLKTPVIEKWVKDYYKDLYIRARFKTGNSALAEDLVQETFLSAYRGYSKFKGESSPRTWLMQILHNKIADHFRKKYKSPIDTKLADSQYEVTSHFDSFGNWEPNGYEKNWESPHLLDNEDFNLHFSTCIGHLPDQWSGIIMDKYIRGKKTDLICQENQISTTNYWQVIHRAKLMLKKCLERYFKE
ncbi:sigma-70 family RNA polymerase sigma factor [Fontibacter flavus]|uniref:RNA polymerase sigma factor n=1 Tax=Fontibacter flavus TaxID=654838 RepID=A0ABV6FWW1_9BACT